MAQDGSCTDQVVPWAPFTLVVGVGIGILIAMFFNPNPTHPPTAAAPGALQIQRDERGHIVALVPGGP